MTVGSQQGKGGRMAIPPKSAFALALAVLAAAPDAAHAEWRNSAPPARAGWPGGGQAAPQQAPWPGAQPAPAQGGWPAAAQPAPAQGGWPSGPGGPPPGMPGAGPTA